MPGGKAVRKIGSREITRYRLRIKIYIKLLDISQRSLLRGHWIVTCNDTCSHYIYNLCDTFRDKRCRYFRHLLKISVVGHFYLLERLPQFLLILIGKKIIAGGLLKKCYLYKCIMNVCNTVRKYFIHITFSWLQ